ncbi:MAG: NUDIX hydrolase [Acidobacteria bacterium]|nr:NUDIX hydrolase [Acidobacteriota bacterium]
MSATIQSNVVPEVVFDGRVIRVERNMVTLANGRTTLIEAVRHRGSVVMIPQPTPESMVLVRQFRPVINRWIWELPAGSLDEGEAPALAAVRECEEEITLTPRRVTHLASWYPTPGFCDELMHFYLCEDLVTPGAPVAQDEDEQIEPATFSLADVRTMIADGRIVDMKTVVGLTLVQQRQAGSHETQFG